MCDDADLVHAYLAGDTGAFATLFRKYAPGIYALALSITSNPTDAQDVVQETFLRASQRLGTFRFQADLYMWLSTIARRLAFRCHLYYDRYEVTQSFPDRPDEHGSAFELLVDMQEASIVQQTIAALRPQQRQAVLLRIEGLSYKEIGARIQCSEASARTNMFFAIKNLRQRLCA